MFTTTSKPAFFLSSLAALVLLILSTPTPFTHSSTFALAAPLESGYRYRDEQPGSLLGHQYHAREESDTPTDSPMLAQALSPSHANDHDNTEQPEIESREPSKRQSIRMKKHKEDRLGARFGLRRQNQPLAAASRPGSASRSGSRARSRHVARGGQTRSASSGSTAKSKAGIKLYRSEEEGLVARKFEKVAGHFEGSTVKADISDALTAV